MRANPFESQLERLARTLTEHFGVTVLCQGDCACTDAAMCACHTHFAQAVRIRRRRGVEKGDVFLV
jgi:hypothetical protein